MLLQSGIATDCSSQGPYNPSGVTAPHPSARAVSRGRVADPAAEPGPRCPASDGWVQSAGQGSRRARDLPRRLASGAPTATLCVEAEMSEDAVIVDEYGEELLRVQGPLAGAQLEGAHLHGAVLPNADLSEADLYWAILWSEAAGRQPQQGRLEGRRPEECRSRRRRSASRRPQQRQARRLDLVARGEPSWHRPSLDQTHGCGVRRRDGLSRRVRSRGRGHDLHPRQVSTAQWLLRRGDSNELQQSGPLLSVRCHPRSRRLWVSDGAASGPAAELGPRWAATGSPPPQRCELLVPCNRQAGFVVASSRWAGDSRHS